MLYNAPRDGIFKDFYGFVDFYRFLTTTLCGSMYVYVGLMVLRCSPTTRGQHWRCCASLGLGRHWLCLQASERLILRPFKVRIHTNSTGSTRFHWLYMTPRFAMIFQYFPRDGTLDLHAHFYTILHDCIIL